MLSIEHPLCVWTRIELLFLITLTCLFRLFGSHSTKSDLFFTSYKRHGPVRQLSRAAASIIICLYTKGDTKEKKKTYTSNCCGILTVLMQQSLQCVFTASLTTRCELLVNLLTFKKKEEKKSMMQVCAA